MSQNVLFHQKISRMVHLRAGETESLITTLASPNSLAVSSRMTQPQRKLSTSLKMPTLSLLSLTSTRLTVGTVTIAMVLIASTSTSTEKKSILESTVRDETKATPQALPQVAFIGRLLLKAHKHTLGSATTRMSSWIRSIMSKYEYQKASTLKTAN